MSFPDASSTFLGAVASAYVSRYDDMSDICFVFPNKRSGYFFLKNLTESLGNRVMLAPEITDISRFASRLTGLEEASRIDLLFRLYRVYCSIIGRKENLNSKDRLLDFDRFASWGEVLTGDFSEVEQYCVDASKIFENVRDYRNISSNFLTEKQLEIIERYFGYRPAYESVEGFWKTVYDGKTPSQLREKFVELWKLLPELFTGLVENLEKDGVALRGTILRKAMEMAEESDSAGLPWSHVVFVGFNMLSTSEARIFRALSKLKDADGDPYAEFFWDATGPVLGDAKNKKSHAGRDLHRYIKEFPMPAWAMPYINLSNRQEMPPSLTIAASPSNVAQVKIASGIVDSWMKTQADEEIRDARAAIIVPDENLLMPLLHSLPEGLESVNLTMGYSMRFTAVASFIYHLKRLQTRRRKTGGTIGYYHEDLLLLLAHPLVHVLIGSSKANEINTEIRKRHLRVVTPEWLSHFSEPLARILTPIPADADAEESIAYIDSVLKTIDSALASESESELRTVNTKMERVQISTYRYALTTLLNSVTLHGIKMNFISVFHLADRLVSGEKVNFEGRPLQGLQVMGLLETRAIDFDHLIILSMNDKIMPRRARKRTFIPDSLRRGYGMPSSTKSEDLYSYYFYRLLSRARNVTLIYDARAGEGMRSGGKSRYLMQLEMVYARGLVRLENHSFRLDAKKAEPQGVTKTEAVMQELSVYKKNEDQRYLSASALMNYCMCPVKFYYKNVCGISDDNPPADHIDPITQGNIVHHAMLTLYFPKLKRRRYLAPSERITLTRESLHALLEDKEKIRTAVRHAVNLEHFKLKGDEIDRELTGAAAIVADRLARQIEDVIRHDMQIAPIELIGGEFSGKTEWTAVNGHTVNMSYAFDRVDKVGGRLRVVDYKTGSAHVAAESLEDVFTGEYKAKYMLQLLLYAHLLEDFMKEKEGAAEDTQMLIYDLNTIGYDGPVEPTIKKVPVKGHKEVSGEFLVGMKTMLDDIFNPDKPFEPTGDEAACKFCRLKSLCGTN